MGWPIPGAIRVAPVQRAGGEDRRTEIVTPPTGKSGCTIESNISAGGQRIYHLPGSRDDARTCVNDRAGE